MDQGLSPRPLGYEPKHADHCPIAGAVSVSKGTSVPIVSSVDRALEHVRRAVLLVNAVVLTSGVRADRIGLDVEDEIVVVGVVKGVVAVVVVIRAVEQRKATVEVGSR